MLRLGLIENLRTITTRLARARVDRDLADFWADPAAGDGGDESLEPGDRGGRHGKVGSTPLTSSFVAEFCQRRTCFSAL